MSGLFRKLTELPLATKLRLLFYPLFLVWGMPIAWAKSLWNSRILLNGQWDRYMGFHPRNAINSLFYRTQWININRYGRFNRSPILGLGNYDLKNWWHLSTLSSYIYTNAGAVTTLVGTLVWVFSHLIWLQGAKWWWVLAVTLILFLSTTSYAMAFARQNYQILGWMWYPTALYATFEGQYILATFVWFAAGVFGITPIFFAVPIVFYISSVQADWWLLCTLLPSLVWTAFRFGPLLLSGGTKESVQMTAMLIGASRKKVRYSRGMNRYGHINWYFTLLYSAATITIWVSSQQPPYLLFLGVLFYAVNQRFFRVADEQSLYLVFCSLLLVTAINSPVTWLVLIALCISLNPFGVFLGIEDLRGRQLSGLFTAKPFDVEPLREKMETFFQAVNPGQRVIFAFHDPLRKYSNIFDGYRELHELPLWLAAEKGFHLMPDFYAVMETNFDAAANIWGLTQAELVSNCDTWCASYIVTYKNDGEQVAELTKVGFQKVSELDWSRPENLALFGDGFFDTKKPPPRWFLFERIPEMSA